MAQQLFKLLIGTFAIQSSLLIGAFAAFAEDEEKVLSTSVYSGTDFAKGSFSYNVGTSISVNRPAALGGLVVDFVYSKGEFGDLVEDGSEGVDSRIDLKFGYQQTLGNFNVLTSVGYEHRKISLTPFDPTNLVQGSKSGAVFSGNITTSEDIPLFFSLGAQYSTAFDSYDAYLQLGLNFTPKLRIGAEGSTGATEGDSSQRLGAFMTWKFDLSTNTSAELTGYFGTQFVEGEDGADPELNVDGGGGNYGGLGLSFSF